MALRAINSKLDDGGQSSSKELDEIDQYLNRLSIRQDVYISPALAAGLGGESPESLGCRLKLLKADDEMHDLLHKYFWASQQHKAVSIAHIWSTDRGNIEASRYSLHSHRLNRKLLWHGTKVGHVARIMKNGLQITPGTRRRRLGDGIYFASQSAKSLAFVDTSKGMAFLFVCEVLLGCEYPIYKDDATRTSPPPGFDAVVGVGRLAPDPLKCVGFSRFYNSYQTSSRN